MKHIVSISGGKDSALTLAIALDKYGSDVSVLFCDTGNEHDYVYEHIEYLERKLGVKVAHLKASFGKQIAGKRKFIANDQRTKRRRGNKIRWSNKRKRIALEHLRPSGNPMLDLCIWKGRFPSRRAQFCTQFLKISIAEKYQNEIYENNEVTVWTGVRRDESAHRANTKGFEMAAEGFYFKRPLVDMTTEEVFAGLKYYGLEPNPLYGLGFTRVGCLPCINANKNEIRLISELFPERIDNIREWERIVGGASRRGMNSFFHARTKGLANQEAYKEARIDNTVLWSKTARGGKQYEMPNISKACLLSEGMCE